MSECILLKWVFDSSKHHFSFFFFRVGKTSLVVMKCLEGLYVSCSELNEITKNAKTASMPTSSSHSDSSSYSSSSRSHLLQSIETVERVNDIYLFIINLLIIFQDGSLLNSLVNEKMVVPKWFKERANVEVSFYLSLFFLCDILYFSWLDEAVGLSNDFVIESVVFCYFPITGCLSHH